MPQQRRKRESKRQGKKRSRTTQAEVPQWEVEYIKLARINEYGGWEYLIAWHGFTEDDDTWEPKSSLGVDCSRLLDSFHEEIERKEDDPPPLGTLLEPSDEWIRQEIAYFHRIYGHQEQPALPENDSEDGEFVMEGSNDEVSEPPVREELGVRSRTKSRARRNANPLGRTRARPIEQDSDSEDEVIEIITPKKRKRVTSDALREDNGYHKSGRNGIEDEDEDDDDIPLTQLSALRAAKKRTRAASFNEPQTNSLDFTSLSISDDTSDPSPRLSPPNVTHKSDKPKPPPLVIPSSLANSVVDPDSPLDSTIASGSTTGAGLTSPFKSLPKRKKLDKGKGKEKETTTQLPTPFSVLSTANPANSALATKRRLTALALNPQTPQEIVEESKRKRYASLKFQKLDPVVVATGANEMREEEELFSDAGDQGYDEDQGMDVDMLDTSLLGPERERSIREHSSERWRSSIPSPMRSPVLVPSTSPAASSAKEPPPGLYESQPQLFQQHSPPPTPILQRTMTSFNAAPSPFQSPVMIPKDAFARCSRNNPIENQNDEFDAFDSFILDDYSEGDHFSGFIHYEPESLAGCPLFDHDDNPLGDQLSIPDIISANNVEHQVEEGAGKPVITQVVDRTKGVPATPTTHRVVPKPNFFFSPRNRLPTTHKPWEWSGSVRLFTQITSSSSQEKSDFEVLCDTVLTTTTPAVEDGMSFAVAMSSMETLDLTMFSLQSLASILAACKKVHQVAAVREVPGLGIEANGKEGALKKLASYMRSRKMVAIVEFHLEQHSSGIILLIPPNLHLLRCLGITVIGPVRQCACIAALLPWSLPPILPSGKPADVMDWEKREPSQYLLTHMAHTNTHFKFSKPISKRQMGFEERLRFLRLPAWLYDDLNGRRKGYHIFNIGDSSSSKEARTECMFLQSVLRHPRLSSQTKHIKHLDENTVKAVRIVFIHAASLQSLHKVPFLVDLKRKKDGQSLDVAFYMFGTSSTVDSRRWCFEEVYTLGGVVTFTPLALFENSEVVSRIVRRVSEHPIWVGYVIPSVVGLAIKLWYQRLDLDPLQEFERGTFIFNSLLTLIDDGKLSLIHAPPESPNEDRYNWVLDQTESVLRDPKDTLEYCLEEFDRRYGHLSQNEWVQAVEVELSTDFQKMHIQPIVMNNWRRMVVLTSEVNRYCDGLEWVSCNDFQFDDASDDL